MPENDACLGICYFNNQLFYAVNSARQPSFLTHIGAVDFNYDIDQSLLANNTGHIEGLCSHIHTLKDRFNTGHLRLLVYPHRECWTILPKLVYDNAGERDAYINILMSGRARKEIHPSWHPLSKDNLKLLQLRTDDTLQGLQALAKGTPNVEYVSDFEIGSQWIEHARPGGSFLTIGAFKGGISVSSFILGKLRGATFIEYDTPEDLPYFWLQRAKDLPWMQGLHEQIQVYGYRTHRIIEILEPFWDDAAEVTKMDQLEKMNVRAGEDTYGFDLAQAYPAIMLAIS